MTEDTAPGEMRPGETRLPFDPSDRTQAGLAFIGHLRSPWTHADCPRNLRGARERGGGARIVLARDYAPGLAGLSVGQPILLLYWADAARRDPIVQAPRHADGPRGTFALRSPRRPNPILAATVRITDLDAARGEVGIDAIDAPDGTPVIDLKPWLPTIDAPSDT